MNAPSSTTASRKRLASKTIIAPTIAADAVDDVLELHEAPVDGLASVDPEFRQEMVATAAYFIAEQRGFAPGHELEDWRAAEEAVNAALLKNQRG